jgi:GTP-binding protein
VVAVNKWDLIKERTDSKEKLGKVLEEMRAELFFLDYAPLLLVSAKTKAEFTRLFKTIEKVRAGSQQRIGTGQLNRLLQTAINAHPPGSRSGKRFKLLYGTQPDVDSAEAIPIPEFVLFVNDDKLLAPTYIKYLEKQIREHTPYEGARQADGRDRSHGAQKRKPAESGEEAKPAAPRPRRPDSRTPRTPKRGGRKQSRKS